MVDRTTFLFGIILIIVAAASSIACYRILRHYGFLDLKGYFKSKFSKPRDLFLSLFSYSLPIVGVIFWQWDAWKILLAYWSEYLAFFWIWNLSSLFSREGRQGSGWLWLITGFGFFGLIPLYYLYIFSPILIINFASFLTLNSITYFTSKDAKIKFLKLFFNLFFVSFIALGIGKIISFAIGDSGFIVSWIFSKALYDYIVYHLKRSNDTEVSRIAVESL